MIALRGIFFSLIRIFVQSEGVRMSSGFEIATMFYMRYEISGVLRDCISRWHTQLAEGNRVLVAYDPDELFVTVTHMLACLGGFRPDWAQDVDLSGIFPSEDDHKMSGDKKEVVFWCDAIVEDRSVIEGKLGGTYQRCDVTVLDSADTFGFDRLLPLLNSNVVFPVKLYLIDFCHNDRAKGTCRGFVFLPDCLIDVTAVAQSFQWRSTSFLSVVFGKFMPQMHSIPLLKGNIVNHLLDLLILDETLEFDDLLPVIFQKYSLHWALLDDRATGLLLGDLRMQFLHLKQCLAIDFVKQGIDTSRALIEPSFYDAEYGLQGRLDLFVPASEEGGLQQTVVELKSSKPFRPNDFGLTISHYIQTILYQRITARHAEDETKQFSYIMYSALPHSFLKYAPINEKHMLMAVWVRNQIVLSDLKLARLGPEDDLLELFSLESEELIGYASRDRDQFVKVYRALSTVERRYFNLMLAFTVRDYQISKIGDVNIDRRRGQSALWLSSRSLKQVSYDIISFLIIEKLETREGNSYVHLCRTDRSELISNIRQGDIVVLYPEVEGRSPVDFMMTKGSVVSILQDKYVVQLRAVQRNEGFYRAYDHWVLEPDFLDSSYRYQFQSLYSWASSSPQKRSLLLGTRLPSSPAADLTIGDSYLDLTQEQLSLMKKALASPEIFLLWGPPGTGKTSYLVKAIIHHLLYHSEERLLLVAYTNRAVDELCATLEAISEGVRDQYLRIGSHKSVSIAYHDQLLQNKVATMPSRSALRTYLRGCRIAVGTVSSILGKPEIFELQQYDRLIVDEASQILEPMIIGLLSRIPRAILIGDHRQLPAVVLQTEAEASVAEASLQEIGLLSCADSWFERMFLLYQKKDAHWAFGMLRNQARMHHDISEFVSSTFYNGRLSIMTEVELKRQKETLDSGSLPPENRHYPFLSNQRLVFIDVASSSDSPIFLKKSDAEAKVIVKVVEDLLLLSPQSTIGIISTFRSQIANIRWHLQQSKLDLDFDLLTIDTVERYQGSARDVIIYSPAIQDVSQLDQIVSTNREGCDRKFNVVLSRARDRVVVVGNKNALSHSPAYRSFIKKYESS